MRRLLVALVCLASVGCSKGRPEPNSLEPVLADAKAAGLATSLSEIDDQYQSKEDQICESLSRFASELERVRPHFFIATRLLDGKRGQEAIEAFRELKKAVELARSIPTNGIFAPERDLTDLSQRYPKSLDHQKDAIRLLIASSIAIRLRGETGWESDFESAKKLALLAEQGPTMHDKLHYISCINVVIDGAEKLAVPKAMVTGITLPKISEAFGYEIGRFRQFIRLTDSNEQEKLADKDEARVDLYRRLNHEEADKALVLYLKNIVALAKLASTNPNEAIRIGNEAVEFGKSHPKDLPARVVSLQLPICISLIKKHQTLKSRLDSFDKTNRVWNPALFDMNSPKNSEGSRSERESSSGNRRPALPDLQ